MKRLGVQSATIVALQSFFELVISKHARTRETRSLELKFRCYRGGKEIFRSGAWLYAVGGEGVVV